MKLSAQMEKAILAIREGGYTVYPEGGGFWRTDAGRVDFSTHTVYALARRGVLKRAAVFREPWRDTYILADIQEADRRAEQRNADRIDGYDRDDLGESPDY